MLSFLLRIYNLSIYQGRYADIVNLRRFVAELVSPASPPPLDAVFTGMDFIIYCGSPMVK